MILVRNIFFLQRIHKKVRASEQKFERKSNFKMRGVAESNEGKSESRPVQAFHDRIRSFPHPISLPPLILKFNFRPFFGLYSQAETINVTTKTRTKILGEVLFEKVLLRNLHDAIKIFSVP